MPRGRARTAALLDEVGQDLIDERLKLSSLAPWGRLPIAARSSEFTCVANVSLIGAVMLGLQIKPPVMIHHDEGSGRQGLFVGRSSRAGGPVRFSSELA